MARHSADHLSRCYASAYRVIFRLTGDAGAADVLARDALVRTGSGRSTLRRRSPEARTCLRAAGLALQDELWMGRPRGPAAGNGFGEISYRDERRRLRMAVRALFGRQRKVFVLEQLAGWAPSAVMAEFGLTPESYQRVSDGALRVVRERGVDATRIPEAV